MMSIVVRVIRKMKRLLGVKPDVKSFDFNKTNPLGGNGERVDIQLNKNISYREMDVYQKNHWKRYEFAKKIVKVDDVCGDFACGTGYGSILLSEKAAKVVGADINSEVIEQIRNRYRQNSKVDFYQLNLLDLDYLNFFDIIVSFETLEHFNEADIRHLLKTYNRALKANGRFVFSTPYMQQKSEEAVKMGFHLTFFIDEIKITEWLSEAGFRPVYFRYQNYDTHHISEILQKKEFVICVAHKIQ